MAEDYQELIQRRAVVADQIVDVIETLGQLAAEARALEDRLRKFGEANGVKANAFSTQPNLEDGINSELSRALTPASISPRRSDPRLRLDVLVRDQNRRHRAQREVRELVAGQSAA